MKTLPKDTVKDTLNMIGYYREFTVVFTKKDGTQRQLTGMMEKPEGAPKSKDAVAIMVTKGDVAGQWRSFRIDSVLGITEA